MLGDPTNYNINSVDGLECIYCGDAAWDRDHVIAHSLTNKSERTYTAKEVVPACKDCNSALSNKTLFTVAERAKWLAQRLKRKHAKLLKSEWVEEDFEGIGNTLRSYIAANQNKRTIVISRIDRCERVSRMTNLTPTDYWDAANASV